MTWITLTGIGMEVSATTSAGANPQLQFFENFPGHLVNTVIGISQGTLSVHAVNIPLSLSFNYPVFLATQGANNASRSGTISIRMGLYSLNGNTLSLANSASNNLTWEGNATNTSWISLITSATQNITPGAWYFGAVVSVTSNAGGGGNTAALYANSNINPANAIPGGFLMGRMTVSTGAMPGSIATSELDITGSDATRQPFIIITA